MAKITYIGEEILGPGKHVIFCGNGSLCSPEKDGNHQVFVPEGYQFAGCGSGINFCYVNEEPVKVKVYQKGIQKFRPEFGTPVRNR